jgi:hypothetical protein
MSDTLTTDIAPTVAAYLAALSETDEAARTALVHQAWAEDGQFFDPLLHASGHAAIGDLAVTVVEHYPGHTFRRTTGIDGHHSIIRFGWELAAPDGTVAVAGVDVGVLDDDGRLSRMVGFYGEPPALEG